MANPLIRKNNKMTGFTTGGHKSAGILDDYKTAKVTQTQELKLSRVWHAYGGFRDGGDTIALETNTYAHITNGTGNLLEFMESDEVILYADSFGFLHAGDYFGSLSISVSGLPGKDFHFRIYNVTQGKIMGYEMGISTTGAANNSLLSMPIYIETNAYDQIQFQVKSADGTDAVLSDCIFYISYLHE